MQSLCVLSSSIGRLSGFASSGVFVHLIGPKVYAGNLGLCGDPLPLCEGSTMKARTGVIIGAALGRSAAIVALVVGGGMMFVMRKVVRKIERKKKKILMKINGPGV
ncbi:hypothetical protein Hdeb2414_s0001g00030191 [Helianthus debilis subsp. tardiflorus]